MEKTHWKKAFKSDYLSSSDIDEKELNLTIEKVIYKECITASGKKFCNVAIFKEKDIKPMILNVYNSKLVKKFSGGLVHIDDWLNIPVKIYVDTKVKFGSDTVEGLRIRETQPTTSKPAMTPEHIAWAKVVAAYKTEQSFDRAEKVYFISDENKQLIIKQANGN